MTNKQCERYWRCLRRYDVSNPFQWRLDEFEQQYPIHGWKCPWDLEIAFNHWLKQHNPQSPYLAWFWDAVMVQTPPTLLERMMFKQGSSVMPPLKWWQRLLQVQRNPQ